MSKVGRAGPKPHRASNGMERAFPFLDCTSPLSATSRPFFPFYLIFLSHLSRPSPTWYLFLYFVLVFDSFCSKRFVMLQNRGKEFPPSH